MSQLINKNIFPRKINIFFPKPYKNSFYLLNYCYIGECEQNSNYIELFDSYNAKMGDIYNDNIDLDMFYGLNYVKVPRTVIMNSSIDLYIILHGDKIEQLYETIKNNYLLAKIL